MMKGRGSGAYGYLCRCIKMIIDVRTNEVVYITINDEVIYIDDSTGELIIDTWKVDGEDIDEKMSKER